MIIECVICYEHLKTSGDVCHTPCGHVFHYSCLSQWMSRSLTCPECRNALTRKKVGRLYLHFVEGDPEMDAAIVASFQTQISTLNHDVLMKELEIVEINDTNARLTGLLKSKQSEIVQLQVEVRTMREDNRVCKNHIEERRMEIEAMQKNISSLTKERDDAMSAKQAWAKISELFDGVTDRNRLVEMISVTKSELTKSTNLQWELLETIMKLKQEIDEISEDRMQFSSMRERQRELESDLACSEIVNVNLRRRVDELEHMLEIRSAWPNNFVSEKTLGEDVVSDDNVVPLKRRKVDVVDHEDERKFLVDITEDTIDPPSVEICPSSDPSS